MITSKSFKRNQIIHPNLGYITWQTGTQTGFVPHLVSEEPEQNGNDGASNLLRHGVKEEARTQQHHFP